MPSVGYSVGRDITIVITLPGGQPLRLGKVTSFTAKQDTTEDRKKLLDGTTDTLRFFDGWSGSIKMERSGPSLDDYFGQLEANYFAGDDEQPATMRVLIQEPNGSISTYRFQRVILKFDDAGDWAADKSVSQSLSFTAARRI